MRKSLEDLNMDVELITGEDIYNALNDIKKVLHSLIQMLDRALPLEVEPD